MQLLELANTNFTKSFSVILERGIFPGDDWNWDGWAGLHRDSSKFIHRCRWSVGLLDDGSGCTQDSRKPETFDLDDVRIRLALDRVGQLREVHRIFPNILSNPCKRTHNFRQEMVYVVEYETVSLMEVLQTAWTSKHLKTLRAKSENTFKSSEFLTFGVKDSVGLRNFSHSNVNFENFRNFRNFRNLRKRTWEGLGTRTLCELSNLKRNGADVCRPEARCYSRLLTR